MASFENELGGERSFDNLSDPVEKESGFW